MIPQGWEEKSLYDIAEITTGKWDANHSVESGLYKFYTCASEPLLCNTFRYCGDCLIFPGNGANVGDVYRYSGKFDAYQRTYVASNIKHINVSYLYYFLLLYWKKANSDKQYGSATNYIKIGNFKDFIISYPPLPEQERIVAKLDEAFEAIDKVKANAEQNLNNAKELFESALDKAFTENTEGWEEKTLNDVSCNLDSKRIPITKNIRKTGHYPYYGASGVVDYVEDYIFDGTFLLISEDGANLLMRNYPIAFSASGKFWVNNHAHILKFNELITQRFVELYLNHINIQKYITGAAQPKLTQNNLNSIKILFPSLTKQQKIVEKLDALQEQTKQLEAIYTQKIKECDELKQSILQKAFRGEL